MKVRNKVIDYKIKCANEIMMFEEKNQDNFKRFADIVQSVLDAKDPLDAYSFASEVSCVLDKDYKKYFDVSKFQNLVMKSNDEDLLYQFARDVVGADVKSIINKLPNGYAKRELIKDLRVIGKDEEPTL